MGLGPLSRAWNALGWALEGLRESGSWKLQRQLLKNFRVIHFHIDGYPNSGPFLGPLNTRCRIILRTQQGTMILTTTQYGTYKAIVEFAHELLECVGEQRSIGTLVAARK